ncbi:MAG: phosphoribosylamine--glycine ligase, partial [Myxococcales bacterium]|nr:phosphoribosylamine--glycine ligase [Myxococcales bacterium]
YAGLMVTGQGIKVLEFNCRFGDPETQVLLPLLETDLLDVVEACLDGRLADLDLRWSDRVAATVVLASAGYPGSYRRGLPIAGLPCELPDATVFHAGTRWTGETWQTDGGRVLCVTGTGDDLPAALAHAYTAAETIHFEGRHLRRDIGRMG